MSDTFRLSSIAAKCTPVPGDKSTMYGDRNDRSQRDRVRFIEVGFCLRHPCATAGTPNCVRNTIGACDVASHPEIKMDPRLRKDDEIGKQGFEM